jgi:hypothetical protein
MRRMKLQAFLVPLALCHLATPAGAQELTPTAAAQGATDVVAPAPAMDARRPDAKERRLAIAGWTLLTTGVVLVPVAVLTQSIDGRGGTDDARASAALVRTLSLGLAGAVLVATGGGLLLRRRVLRNRRLRELRLTMQIGALFLTGTF